MTKRCRNNRKARSRSALPQQRWWSSSITEVTFSSSKEAKNHHKHINYLKAQAEALLPPARGIQKSRTENLAKPARPLSGCVFLRRSSKHGWVAKAYPQPNSSYSHPDILSSVSTDSFFDDDFEEESVEKLGSLLSCGTLGVDTKAVKHDWVAGELNIPKFHCPRCRDHWYKFSSFPCDEEFARLTKEDLWYTGNEPKGDRNRPKQNKVISSESQINSQERKGLAHLNRLSHRDKHQKQKDDMYNRKVSGSGNIGCEWSREDDEEIKRKRTITFQLQESISEGSSADDKILTNSKQSLSGEQQQWSDVRGSGHGKDDDATSSGGAGGVSRDEAIGDLGGDRDIGGGRDYGAEVGLGVVSDTERLCATLQDLKISTSNIRNSEREDLNCEVRNKSAKKSQQQLCEGEHARDMSKKKRRENTSDTLIKHGRVRRGSSEMDSAGYSCGSGSNTHQRALKPSSSGLPDDTGCSGNPSEELTTGKKSKQSEASSWDGSVGALSPPFSKWGAHLHAHSISSSIHSHPGSISLGKSDGNGERTPLKADSKTFLQPIVPRIIGPPPQHDLCWQPNITRAWTFSYFNPT